MIRYCSGLAGHFETNVDIASWDFQQTYPDENSDWDPTSLASPSRDFNLKGLQEPAFNLTVTAKGSVTAHLRPTLSFGITFEDTWKIGKCTAELAVDGWVRPRARRRIWRGRTRIHARSSTALTLARS